MTTAEKYVTAAYVIVFAAVLLYVVIIALKLARLERELGELVEDAAARARERGDAADGHERKKVAVG